MVTVSNFIKKQLATKYGFDSAIVIPNTSDLKPVSNTEKLPFDYCIAVGRLVSLKQFDKLVVSYSNSILPQKNIHLVILGVGDEQEQIEKQF